METIATYTVKEQPNKIRLIDYVCGLFVQLPTRSSVKKALKRGEILLNGQRAESGRFVNIGDKIDLVDLGRNLPKEYNIELDIIYMDEDLVIINKPAGIVVSGNKFKTIENALRKNITKSDKTDALSWAKPVHRLDAQTSGLLISARTAKALAMLGQMFENKKIQKTYRAVVVGKPPTEGTMNFEIEGQKAVTAYKTIKTVKALKYGDVSLVELYPKTGRTHQIRIHLAKLGHQIIGDKLHGEEGYTIHHKGLFLAAVGLEFIHPISNKNISLKIQQPYKFDSFIDREERRWRAKNNI